MRPYEDHAYGDAPLAEAYWPTTRSRPETPVLEGACEADVAIIGSGYAGLHAARVLAAAGEDVLLLDEHGPGWGASGRNGGFCCLGGAKVEMEELVRDVGETEARLYYQTERAAIDHVAATLEALGADVDRHSEGETYLAHRPRDVARLEEARDFARDVYGVEARLIRREDLAGEGMASPEFQGALTTPLGFALNPMKYVLALAEEVGRSARIRRARVGALSPAEGRWRLATNQGDVLARKVLIATNGYSSDGLPDWLTARFLPIQSNILVTRPLSPGELADQGWTSTQMCYDTRNLLHYFRLMPNARMLFGLRGGTRASPGADAARRRSARRDFERIFPAWAHVETPHFWSGLVCFTRRRTPFIGPVPGAEGVFAALGWHGNGVAMGSYGGSLAGRLMLGDDARPAAFAKPARRYEIGRARRAMLPLALGALALKDL